MLPMSSPEPMPVEEITVLAAFVAVDEIVEPICIALTPIGRYIGTPDQDLSKRHTNLVRSLGVTVDQPTTRHSHTARQRGKFDSRKFADDVAGRRIDLLNDLIAGTGVDPELIRSPGIVEMFVELPHQVVERGGIVQLRCRSGRRSCGLLIS